VKLLFDQNLSRHLIDHVRDVFPDSSHVALVGLAEATDEEVWEFAGANDCIVVSKDSDFRQLAFLHGPPPKVVWLRLGNVTTVDIATVILDHNETIERFAIDEDEALLVLAGA
jgi:predicted nuclease of predicted toxin-antitoxin system